MNQQLTTYRAKGKTIGLEFLFKYDLNGNLKVFEIVEGELDERQRAWLFSNRFPVVENTMRTFWMKSPDYKKHFDVSVSPADLSFEAFWNLYDYKVDKIQTIKYFKRLSEPHLIKLFLSIPEYKKFCVRKKIAMRYPSTYITQQSFLDDYKNL